MTSAVSLSIAICNHRNVQLSRSPDRLLRPSTLNPNLSADSGKTCEPFRVQGLGAWALLGFRGLVEQVLRHPSLTQETKYPLRSARDPEP